MGGFRAGNDRQRHVLCALLLNNSGEAGRYRHDKRGPFSRRRVEYYTLVEAREVPAAGAASTAATTALHWCLGAAGDVHTLQAN